MIEGTFAKSGRAASPRPLQISGKAVLAKPPCRLLRRGVTLVELLIAMLILTIVCIAWLQIIGIQSARKEARRREAVERLSGMMDAFMCKFRGECFIPEGGYKMKLDESWGVLSFLDAKREDVHPVFDEEVSPIGYQLRVVTKKDLPDAEKFDNSWGESNWLVGRLYDRSNCTTNDAGKPFFTLSVCLW